MKRLLSLVPAIALMLFLAPFNSQAQSYCTPSNTGGFTACGCVSFFGITSCQNYGTGRVTIDGNDIYSSGTCFDVAYDDKTNLSAPVTEGQTHSISVGRTGTDYASYIHAYADWNLDGTFGAGSETLFTTYISGTNTTTFTFTVPVGTAAGAHRLRIVNSFISPTACTTEQGQTYDFELIVQSACTSPATQASGLTATVASGTSLDIGWTRGDGDNVLVVARESSTAAAEPALGTNYTPNTAFGTGNTTGSGNFAVYDGSGTSVTVTGLTQGVSYAFDIYEYNNTGVCYLTPAATVSETPSACTPPTTQASGFSGTSLTTTSLNATWTRGNGDEVLVVARQGSAVNADPSIGTGYAANANFSSGDEIGTGNYVVYKGTGSSETITGLTQGNTYHFALYEFESATNCYNLTEHTGTAEPLNPMVVSSVTTTQNTANVQPNQTNEWIIRVPVTTTGGLNPAQDVTAFTFNTNGSDAPAGDITNARVFYTGTSGSFSAANQFGAAVANPNGSFTVNGSQTLAVGTNYFWLAYDIAAAPAVTIGNDVDAECTSVTIDGAPQTPTVTAPSGVRNIQLSYCTPTGSVSACTPSIFGNNDYGIDRVVIDGNDLYNDGSVCFDEIYWDGTAIHSMNVDAGQSYSIFVRRDGTNYPSYVNVYVDWNLDGDFTDAGEQIFSELLGNGVFNSSTYTMNVPAGASPGNHRIRVISSFYGGFSPTLPTSCTQTQGQMYDFTLDVQTACATNTWTGTTNTDWFTDANWSCGTVPVATDDVVIPDVSSTSNNFPVIDALAGGGSAATANDLTVDAGASISFPAVNPGELEVSGNLTNNGTTDMGEGRIKMVGSSTQTLAGSLTIRDLNVENDVDVTGSVAVGRALNLINGDMDVSAGSLTMLSDATETAYIDDFSSGHNGTLSGNNVTVQRYVPGSGMGFHYVGSAVSSNNEVSDLGGEISLATMNGATDGTPITPTSTLSTCSTTEINQNSAYGGAFEYDESITSDCIMSGWVVRASGNLATAKGLAARITGGTTIDFTGSYQTGDITSYNLSGTGNNTAAPNYNIVANPHASAIQWNLVATANSGSITGTAFLWQTGGGFAGTYQSYNNVVTTNIASQQAFFVVANSHNATMSFPQNARTTNNPGFLQQGAPYNSRLDLMVEGNGFADMTYVAFDDDFTTGFDNTFDARKMKSADGQPTVYTLTDTDVAWQAINALPDDGTVHSVPLGLAPGANGNFTFSANGLGTFPTSTLILLEDLKEGTITNLRETHQYSFSAHTGDDTERFVLHFTPRVLASTSPANCEGVNGVVSINLGQFTVSGTPFKWDSYELLNDQGAVISSGNQAHGQLIETQLSAGNYTLRLTEGTYTAEVTDIVIEAPQAVTADFTVSSSTIHTGETVSFNNSSTGAHSYEWYFGDGAYSTTEHPVHTYQQPGNYEVTLMAYNGDCSEENSFNLKVDNVTSVQDIDGEALEIYAFNNTLVLQFHNFGVQQADFEVLNMLGQLVTDKNSIPTEGQQTFNFNSIPSGMYIVRVKVNSNMYQQKVWFGK